MDSNKDIQKRVYLIYFLVCLFAISIVAKVIVIQFVEGEQWKIKAELLTTSYKNIEAVRGNIYASDGSLLATSIPIYEVRMDLNTPSLSDKVFNEDVDSLCISLSDLFADKTPTQWKRELVRARKDGKRFHLIKRKVNYNQLKQMRQFPLFRLGRYKGGLIYLQQNKRERPFRLLAARTIGYDREGVQPVGLEGAYRKELRGVDGKRLMQKIAGGVWMPLSDENDIEPRDGSDIYTTIDINIQDVAESALLEQLTRHDADHGCVVLMEVQTGEIKAIANLARDIDGNYYEYYNYAIGESTEPGSIFKLPALMAGLEDGKFKITDSIDGRNGKVRYYDRVMADSRKGGYGKMSIQRAFEVSSNVGVSQVLYNSYWKQPQAFIDRLHQMGLHRPLGIEIIGEGKPYIKNTTDESWSGVTLPWMSIGYESRMTALQILTFYNAVANDGQLVKPMFVKQIKKRGKVIRNFSPVVINDAICSQSTIEAAKQMLQGVVERGTARNLRNDNYKIAGKTGTAQIANDKYGYKYKSKVSYQASFVGYFPADQPKYSCIVVVNAPSKNVYYGNLVAGPIFKEISDKVYATSIAIHKELEHQPTEAITRLPVSMNGNQQDLKNIFDHLDIPANYESESTWAITTVGESSVDMQPRKVRKEMVPNVVGMGYQDALYILENLGMIVKASGKGVIKSQSLRPGTVIEKGNQIELELS